MKQCAAYSIYAVYFVVDQKRITVDGSLHIQTARSKRKCNRPRPENGYLFVLKYKQLFLNIFCFPVLFSSRSFFHAMPRASFLVEDPEIVQIKCLQQTG
jgi:hypothetical protein